VVSDAQALLELLRLLKARDYSFTPVTPATHARIIARPCERPSLRDIFGWNRRFADRDLAPDLQECLSRSGMIERDREKHRSKVRVASLGDDLFLHSAYPTLEEDAVFFGPDTYRFVRFVREQLPRLERQPSRIVDMGAGSGAAGIAAAHLVPTAQVIAVDINPAALRLAAINAEAAGVSIEPLLSPAMPQGADLVIANPPYIMDAKGRSYRDGGDLFGGQVALDWARQALASLTPGGTMLLYTGGAVVKGEAPLMHALDEVCQSAGVELVIEETDPDVFGEELEQPAYADVERIALFCVTIRRR
jgi:methylase of polypeptide subunit release factors